MKETALQRFFYFLLFVLLGVSAWFFIEQLFNFNTTRWNALIHAYLVVLLLYTWVQFVLLFIADIHKRTYPKYAGQKISVVIPCYNEDPVLLKRSIDSVQRAR